MSNFVDRNHNKIKAGDYVIFNISGSNKHYIAKLVTRLGVLTIDPSSVRRGEKNFELTEYLKLKNWVDIDTLENYFNAEVLRKENLDRYRMFLSYNDYDKFPVSIGRIFEFDSFRYQYEYLKETSDYGTWVCNCYLVENVENVDCEGEN